LDFGKCYWVGACNSDSPELNAFINAVREGDITTATKYNENADSSHYAIAIQAKSRLIYYIYIFRFHSGSPTGPEYVSRTEIKNLTITEREPGAFPLPTLTAKVGWREVVSSFFGRGLGK
jgi:hypothetical protein